MPALVGITGAERNACVAIGVDGEIRAACEQERLTRVRGAGLQPKCLPVEAVTQTLSLARCRPDDVLAYVIAESQVQLPRELPTIAIDHHRAHAATAFLTSSFQRAAVLVCDSSPDRELSVWSGQGADLTDEQWPWRGRGIASLYGECAELFEFGQRGNEHRLEALAHLGKGERAEELRSVFRYADGSLEVERDWRAHIVRIIERDERRNGQAVSAASAVQRRLGEVLLDLVEDIRLRLGHDTLCLGGGLFFNTYFTSLIRSSGIFTDVFVPINPGNAGLAVGGTLMVGAGNGETPKALTVSPFLGPEYNSHEIKDVLDGCKLSYAFVSESQAIDAAVEALARGQLVGWFQGRMEWGHRSLGHRSILADPTSPYVLDNLNFFLKKRERWRSFGVSLCDDAGTDLFCGRPSSPFMQYEYSPRDPERLRHVIPPGATSIRVQTVTPDSGSFWALHKRMGQATGAGVLVNTSFNGFHEPIVCSPRDAVRVFYGTGLDMLVIGRFVLRK